MNESGSSIRKHTATLVAVLFFLPVALGSVSALLPAFGYAPAMGFDEFSIDPWRQLFATPGLGNMMCLTLVSGLGATFLSLLLALMFVSSAWGSRSWHRLEKWLSPMMAAPHVALAVGFAFLIMPSGLFSRLLAPVADWPSPPAWQTVQDPFGLSLLAFLILKETPFLTLMLMAAIGQVPVQATLRTGAGLGYQPWIVWVKMLWPQLYSRVRLSVFTVMVFSLSVVDVAIVLGPTTPPTFAVQILEWFQQADLAWQRVASAGSVLLMLMSVASIGLLWLLELLCRKISRQWLTNGSRGRGDIVWRHLSQTGWKLILLLFTVSSLILVVWSFAWRWRFPDLWPAKWSFRGWERAWQSMAEPLLNSLTIGLAAASLGVVLAVLMLESGKNSRWIQKVMYLPLLLPQLLFLLGIQFLVVRAGVEGRWFTVVLMHLLFVLPYCYLSLSGPWRYYDQRHSRQGWLLSGSRVRTFFQIKCMILLKPLLACFALGFAVSIAQYLPTLFAGAGRINSVTTETVALAASGNSRVIGVYALVQMLLPVVFYGIALFLGQWRIHHNRLKRRWI